MTAKETEALRKLEIAVNSMSEKLFGNGTRNGCIDDRLEHVEKDMEEIKEMMPKIVTRNQCSKRHEIRWSHRLMVIGLTTTWIGLSLRVMGVI